MSSLDIVVARLAAIALAEHDAAAGVPWRADAADYLACAASDAASHCDDSVLMDALDGLTLDFGDSNWDRLRSALAALPREVRERAGEREPEPAPGTRPMVQHLDDACPIVHCDGCRSVYERRPETTECPWCRSSFYRPIRCPRVSPSPQPAPVPGGAEVLPVALAAAGDALRAALGRCEEPHWTALLREEDGPIEFWVCSGCGTEVPYDDRTGDPPDTCACTALHYAALRGWDGLRVATDAAGALPGEGDR